MGGNNSSFLLCFFGSTQKVKRKHYKNILFYPSLYVLICTFIKKIIIVFHHDDNALLFYLYVCIEFTHMNNFRKGNLCHDKNNMKLFEKKKRWQKNFDKHVSPKSHWIIANFRILKDLKRIKKFRNYLLAVNFSLRWWFSRQ